MDLAGKSFGLWTVVSRVDGAGKSRWNCRCACGTERGVAQDSLNRGKSVNCGCVRDAAGPSHARFKHGQISDRTYSSWHNMKARCLNKNSNVYVEYGGRGITICPRWADSYEAFVADMGPCPSPKHSIDRKDSTGNYELGNCRWATPIEQAANTRRNRIVIVDGKAMSFPNAYRALSPVVSLNCVRTRLNLGWPLEHACKTPLRGQRP